MDATNGSWLEIDLGALDHNVDAFRRAAGPGVGLCAVVKADGYGLGAAAVARRLDARRVDLLAVFSLEEARELTAAGVAAPLLVLSPVFDLARTDPLYRAAVAGRLQLTVHGPEQLDAVEAVGRAFGCPLPIHLEVDSGMSRGGMDPGVAAELLPRINASRYVALAGLFTHPASADQSIVATNRQLHALLQLVEKRRDALAPDAWLHFANTHAALRDHKFHLSMLRVGLGLYGYGPSNIRGSQHAGVDELAPTVRWLAPIIHTRDVPAGQPVGYGGTYETRRPSRLGVVPVGYADGYPLALTHQAMVRVGDALTPAPIRGQVNMDQLIIDLTDLPSRVAARGATVEVYAADPEAPNALPRLAAAGGTSVYELLCRLSPRLPRKYVTRGAEPEPRPARRAPSAARLGV